MALLEGARRVTWRGLSQTVGTPDYMSPEQLRGERGLAGSDIYAVGIILYELLCGQTPFEGENVFAIINQHITQDPPSILDYNPDISPALATVVMHAIRRDQEKRYKSITNLRHDLRDLDHVKAVPYQPASPAIHNNLRIGLLVTLIIVVLLVGMIMLGLLAQLHHAGR